MKQLTFSLLLITLFLCFSCNITPKTNESKPIKNELSKEEEKPLVALCQLWGFLKYHHPDVAAGNYDWDKELTSKISEIQNAKNEADWKEILDNWIDSLPTVPENSNKQLPDKEITQKPNYGELFNPEYFFPETIEKIKFILDNAIISKSHYINVESRGGLMTITNEPYNDMTLYPDLSIRLLALFRYWNIVNYFFPYRELCDQQWSDVLVTMLPDFVYAKDVEQYLMCCLKLVTKIDDSHGFFNSNNILFGLKMGMLNVPFETRFIENKLVITQFVNDDEYIKGNLEIGDIITAINGEPVDSVVKRLLPITPASNYAVKLRQIALKILNGNETSVHLTVLKDNTSTDIKVPRFDTRRSQIFNRSNPQPDSEGYRVLDNNIGYVLPSSCKKENRETGIKLVFNNTKGVIIDMRCYPSDYVSLSFLKHLKHSTMKFSLASYANISFPGYFFIANGGSSPIIKRDEQQNLYTNPIVVIVNEVTQSQAEDNVLGFQLAPNVKVIGSTTAGADGNVTFFNFPCGTKTYMTGLGVYYPDGSNLQRCGVKIDEFIEPTINGIKNGRDELLERAIEIIEESTTSKI